MSDIFELILILIVPFLLSVLLVTKFCGDGATFLKRCTFALTLHVDRGLFKQGLFWLFILIPFLYFLALSIIAWQGYSILLTLNGLNEFVKISVVPLAILSLAVPLSVLVSRLHASKQTAEQIKITRQKNNIDLFHSHRKELFSYFLQVGKEKYLDCFDAEYKVHPRVHKNFFSGSPEDGSPEINELAFAQVERDLLLAKNLLDNVISDKNPKMTFDFYIANLCPTIYRLSYCLGLPEIHRNLAEKSVYYKSGNDLFLTVGKSTDEIIAAYRYAKNYFINLCDFAGRKFDLTDDASRDYIDSGISFRTIKDPPIIEHLHETTFKNCVYWE